MREEGYYWVKRKDLDDWTVALYCGPEFDGWYLPAFEFDWKDSDFDEIDERRITREIIVTGADITRTIKRIRLR